MRGFDGIEAAYAARATIALVRLFALLFLAFTVRADVQFTAKVAPNDKLAHGKGECLIRVSVDEAAYVSVHGLRVEVHAVSGGEARDEGSECTGPLPDRDFEGFHFAVKEKRNEMRLSESPSNRNGYRAVVFIRDSAPGEGRYVFQLSWKTPTPAPPPGMSFNNDVHSAERGHGEARLDDEAAVTLGKATVDYDSAGNLLVAFDPARGDPVSFSGTVMSLEKGAMKANVAADARFNNLRGPMYLYFDEKRRVFKIELKATNGQQRLTVQWVSGK